MKCSWSHLGFTEAELRRESYICLCLISADGANLFRITTSSALDDKVQFTAYSITSVVSFTPFRPVTDWCWWPVLYSRPPSLPENKCFNVLNLDLKVVKNKSSPFMNAVLYADQFSQLLTGIWFQLKQAHSGVHKTVF